MAAALAFRTLFAVVPVLIVATILVKAISGTGKFIELTRNVLVSLKLNDVHIVPPLDGVNGTTGAAAGSVSLDEWLVQLVEQAASVNLAAVGWVGVAVIGYAAIGLMVTIENSFNTIYRVPEGRPWTRRIPLYWFILTVSPVALGVTSYLNGHVADWIQSQQAWQTLLSVAGMLWSLLMRWLVMLVIYMLLPNTTVTVRSAMAEALAAAAILEIGKRSLDAYLEHAFAISQLYGSLGLVPLFMFWVYLMWLAVLFGLEVSATLHMLGGRDLDQMQPKPTTTDMLDPTSVVTIMQIAAERFAAGHSTTARQISESSSLSESVVAVLLARLVEEGVLHRLDRDAGAVTLARPPEQVSADQLIQIGFDLADEGGPARRSKLVERLRQAQRQLAGKTTLATLVAAEQ